MNIKFKKLIIHNFLSYGHAEIDLNDRGYCLVSGKNNFKADNTISNGSGKSSWISAIHYALTGETCQGVKSDLKNIYVDENSCYVDLTFDVDNISFKVVRYNKPKSDLKVYVNNEDKSGKGIRESEDILKSYLPDLNKNTISSVILLGQGLPNKLSSFTPSGRKECIEQLSKSDFMLEDIKSRITDRLNLLNKEISLSKESVLKIDVENSAYQKSIDDIQNRLQELSAEKYDEDIKETSDRLTKVKEDILTKESIKNTLILSINDTSKTVELANNVKNNLTNVYNIDREELLQSLSSLNTKKELFEKQLFDIRNIKDKCPTCGRPYDNVHKPDSKPIEDQLNIINEDISSLNKKIVDRKIRFETEVKDSLLKSFNVSDVSDLNVNLRKYNTELSLNENSLKSLQLEESSLSKNLARLESSKQNINSMIENYLVDKTKYEDLIKNNNLLKDKESNKLNELESHYSVVKKMETLVKRDFRGYLISNIIEFIDARAKEYCQYMFNSDNFEFKLDGNEIAIMYENKPFESLSGGEKQKVDLIIQFSLRDTMSTYLNFSSNILCLDEIFDNLDSKGVQNVINLISNKLNDIESIFIISHHSDELNIPRDCELDIVKNSKGISEVVY